MARGDYRQDLVLTPSGEPAVAPSAAWKRELMTPILDAVKGPLSTAIWRYMRYEHLEAALRSSALYFPMVELFKEPKEGSFSDRADFRAHDVYRDWDDADIARVEASYEALRRETMQRLFYVSCWHMNTNESELLWNRYMRDVPEAVAVQSTVAELCALRPSIISATGLEFIPRYWAGDVIYIDHTRPGSVPPGQLSLLYKGNEFSGDREFRGIVELWNLGFSQHDNPALPSGVQVDIAPYRFFTQIVAKPGSKGLVEKINALLDEVGYDIPVSASSLDVQPIW